MCQEKGFLLSHNRCIWLRGWYPDVEFDDQEAHTSLESGCSVGQDSCDHDGVLHASHCTRVLLCAERLNARSCLCHGPTVVHVQPSRKLFIFDDFLGAFMSVDSMIPDSFPFHIRLTVLNHPPILLSTRREDGHQNYEGTYINMYLQSPPPRSPYCSCSCRW